MKNFIATYFYKKSLLFIHLMIYSSYSLFAGESDSIKSFLNFSFSKLPVKSALKLGPSSLKVGDSIVLGTFYSESDFLLMDSSWIYKSIYNEYFKENPIGDPAFCGEKILYLISKKGNVESFAFRDDFCSNQSEFDMYRVGDEIFAPYKERTYPFLSTFLKNDTLQVCSQGDENGGMCIFYVKDGDGYKRLWLFKIFD